MTEDKKELKRKIDEEFKDNPIAKFIFGYMLGETDVDTFKKEK